MSVSWFFAESCCSSKSLVFVFISFSAFCLNWMAWTVACEIPVLTPNLLALLAASSELSSSSDSELVALLIGSGSLVTAALSASSKAWVYTFYLSWVWMKSFIEVFWSWRGWAFSSKSGTSPEVAKRADLTSEERRLIIFSEILQKKGCSLWEWSMPCANYSMLPGA